ncbi:hypothetical protein [Clostridium saccharoperbutylacetonicum]|nr:hypothetical protein [Clostridium saccharoperbutylacetonicum]AQR94697.1 hypothetical protein CLSAP_20110 [Clostridium saccharoperbutylacetonicum]NSB30538.1 hypothetical protein [Clostridium saccharoperbutylacetonicum]
MIINLNKERGGRIYDAFDIFDGIKVCVYDEIFNSKKEIDNLKMG